MEFRGTAKRFCEILLQKMVFKELFSKDFYYSPAPKP